MNIRADVTKLTNHFHNNFFVKDAPSDHVHNYKMPNLGLTQAVQYTPEKSIQYAYITLHTSYFRVDTTVYREYFSDFLANIGGLFLSIVGFFNWLISPY